LHALNEHHDHLGQQVAYYPNLVANPATLTPCRALRINKARLIGRGSRRTNGLNETSVEVLKLDASEFSSMSERDLTRKSNNHHPLLTLKSEEHLLGAAGRVMGQSKQFNSTFQYATGVIGENQTQRATEESKHGGGILSADLLRIN